MSCGFPYVCITSLPTHLPKLKVLVKECPPLKSPPFLGGAGDLPSFLLFSGRCLGQKYSTLHPCPSCCPDAQCALTLTLCSLLCPHSPGSVAHLLQPSKTGSPSLPCPTASDNFACTLVYCFLQNLSLHRILLFCHKIKPFKSRISPLYSEPS